jgi:hypothetical protein
MAATLIVIVILLMLGAVFFFGTRGSEGAKSARPDHLGTTMPSQIKYMAKDDACKTNLSNVRASIQIYNSSTDSYPPTLEDTKLSKSILSCPIGHEPYEYDPATGKVHCPHPGHENY